LALDFGNDLSSQISFSWIVVGVFGADLLAKQDQSSTTLAWIESRLGSWLFKT
jgi:hypothetical protein